MEQCIKTYELRKNALCHWVVQNYLAKKISAPAMKASLLGGKVESTTP